MALCVVALPWCISHASGGAGKAVIDRLSRDGYSFGGGGVAVRLAAKPSRRGGAAGGGDAGKGLPLRGGGTEKSEGGGGGTGGGGGAAGDTSSQPSGSWLARGGGTGKVWRGERLNFDGPDNVDSDNQIAFSPPPPPDSPKHQLSYAQMKRVEDRIKLGETDPFERGLAVEAFKTKWAGFLPKPGHLPVHIPLPKDMTVEEVEDIQAKLNAESAAKGRVHGADPAFNVMDRMRRRQAAQAAASTETSKAGGPQKSVVQLALERLSFSSKDALSVFEEEQKMAIAELSSAGEGHGKAAATDKQTRDKPATAAASTTNPRISLPRKPLSRSAALRQHADDIAAEAGAGAGAGADAGASDGDGTDGDEEAAGAAKLFHAHGQGRAMPRAGRSGRGGGAGVVADGGGGARR